MLLIDDGRLVIKTSQFFNALPEIKLVKNDLCCLSSGNSSQPYSNSKMLLPSMQLISLTTSVVKLLSPKVQLTI